MKAWQLRSGVLDQREVASRAPGPGEVVIDVKAAGLCHTDVGYIDSNTPLVYEPITLGHEVAGVVAGAGDGVEDWRVGDQVALISSLDGPGVAYDGGYAMPKISARAATGT